MAFDPAVLDCKLFVASACSIDELQQRIAAACTLAPSANGTQAHIQFGTIDAMDYSIDVRNNPDRKADTYRRTCEAFLFAPYVVEIYPQREISLHERVDFVERIATAISVIPAEVVAACDYEDMLPSSTTLHHPK